MDAAPREKRFGRNGIVVGADSQDGSGPPLHGRKSLFPLKKQYISLLAGAPAPHMARRHKPRRGSLGFWPRKRAASIVPRYSTWPAGPAKPHIENFAGYKVGMTHALMVDFRKRSTTAGQEVSVPVTVLEAPPLKVAGVRLYRESTGGLRAVAELWSNDLDPHLWRRIPEREKDEAFEEKAKKFSAAKGTEVRLIVHTQPHLVNSLPGKTPEIFEVRISGEKVEERKKWGLDHLGKELKIEDFIKEGEMVDVTAVTKGKGFQGHIKRFHVKLQPHKNSKHRRMIGTLGPHNPSYVTYRIPQAGQMGFHRRTEYNKRVLRIVENPKEGALNPSGGFLHYGLVQNPAIVFHGTIPGPARRLVGLRLPMRFRGGQEKIDIRYLSTLSKSGV